MLPRQAVADPPEWIATRASSRSTRDADVEAEDEQWPEEDREEGGQDPRERPERVEVVLDEGHDQPDHSVEQARDLERHQKSWVSPPKMADTESSAKTFMIVSARRPATGRTVMLSGRVSGSIGSVSVTTIPANSASSISAKRTATRARPASGATETTPSPMKPRTRKWRPKSGSAVMWSTGTV